jgi:ribose 5-phosphate isomerase A
MDAKRIAAEYAADTVENNMLVGLGTGSTAYWAIARLAERVREGLQIQAIATSQTSEEQARQSGIPLMTFAELGNRQLDVTIDGADEANLDFQLIKGGGGALLREKIVAAASKRMIVVVDSSKLVDVLGKFPLPVEIVPFGAEQTIRHLRELGALPKLRLNEHGPFLTDNGNYIVDCAFSEIVNPSRLSDLLNAIPGVVENGLFVGMADAIVAGYPDGRVEYKLRG